MNVLYLLGLTALVAFVKGLEPTVCDRQWVKVGCFKDSLNPRPLPEMLINDRDASSKFNDGHVLDWHKWSESLHSLACRCMQKAKEKGYTMFALQFYGECWSGPNAEIKYNKDGAADTCMMDLSPHPNCDKKNSHECVGRKSTNYVYRIDLSQVGSGDKDGGYSRWSNWTECSKTCGGGVKERERTCTNPKPKGNGRNCDHLGPPLKTKECNLEPCSQCQGPMDVGFIVDSSSSVMRRNFKKVTKFLVEFATILKSLNTQTHIGLIRYNHKSTLIFNFKEDPRLNHLKRKLLQLRYKPGGTRTDLALVMANKMLFTAAGGERPSVPHVLLVLTDGRTNSRSRPYPEVLKPLSDKNVKIIAVGVGRNIGIGELKTIAQNHKEKVIHLNDFESLVQDVNKIKKVFCSSEMNF